MARGFTVIKYYLKSFRKPDGVTLYFLPICCMCGLVYEKLPNTSESISLTTFSSTGDNCGASLVNSGSKLLAALAERYMCTHYN